MGGQSEVRTRPATSPLGSVAGQDLVRRLGRMKAGSGLSFARLEAKTAYSRASIERYVNGKLFPSRQAVEEIARACNEDPAEALRLWDAAVAGEMTVGQPANPGGRWTAWKQRVRVSGTVLALAALVCALATGSAPGKGSWRPAHADWCRDYYVEIRVYTIGQMCWTDTDATVTGYVVNQGEQSPALAQLCVSNQPGSCSEIVDLATAGASQTRGYRKTVGCPPGYGVWIRTCLYGFCTRWQ